MITTVLRQALRARGEEPAVLCHTGAHDATRDHLAGLPLGPADVLLDLDSHPMGAPVVPPGLDPAGEEEVGLVAVVAATTTDLHRALTASVHLPRAVHVLVALAAAPGHQEPPVPASPGMGQWRDLLEMRVRRLDRSGWVCELFFPNGVDTAQVLDAVLHGTRGRRRGPAVSPLAALHGPEGALWRPGDTGAHGVDAAGPVPLRRVTPVGDLVLRVGGAGPRPAWGDTAVPALDRATTDTDAWERIAAPGGRARARAAARADASATAGIAPVDESTVNPVGFHKAEGAPSPTSPSTGTTPSCARGERTW